MNIIFFTQSNSLNLYYQVYLRLKKRSLIKSAGFYVANLWHYEKFLKEHSDFETEVKVIKEWEIYQKADDLKTIDIDLIKKYEKKVGEPNLWGPLLTDRRLYFGKRSTYYQDYKPSFSHGDILKVLQTALKTIDQFINDINPDLIITLYTATFGDCLAHLFAKARNIRSFDLRLSRIKNYVMFVDNVSEPPPHMVKKYSEFQSNGIPENIESEAIDYIKTVREKTAKYEGVLSADKSKLLTNPGLFGFLLSLFKKIILDLKHRKYSVMIDKYDLQNIKGGEKFFYQSYLNKINAIKITKKLDENFLTVEKLIKMDYVLYPLHTEPELVLCQFAKPYLNQIEVVRNIALSLPVHMKLVVKEHPLMLGRRPISYYRKLLEIPNVEIADLFMPSDIAMKNAKLMTVIRGAMSLEALIKGIPVLALGRTAFEIYAGEKFCFVNNLYELPAAINKLLTAKDSNDEDELTLLVASIIAGSAPINLLTDLLKKEGRFRVSEGVEVPFKEHPHIDKLTDYLIKRYKEEV